MYDKVVTKQIQLHPENDLNLSSSAIRLCHRIAQKYWNKKGLSGNMNLKSPFLQHSNDGYSYAAVLNNKSDMHEDELVKIFVSFERIMAFELEELRMDIQAAKMSTGFRE